MIWVRLIGGECNGQVRKVDDDQCELTVTQRRPIAASPRLSLAANASFTKVSMYSRRVVKTAEGQEVPFFADVLMSDHEALQSVLGP